MTPDEQPQDPQQTTPSASEAAAQSAEDGSPTNESTKDESRTASTGAGPLIFLIMGLLAGGVSWGVVDNYGHKFFDLPEDVKPLMDQSGFSKEDRRIIIAAELAQLKKNAAASVALCGALLAGLFGLADGLARKSTAAAGLRLIVGVLLGGGLGALGGWLGVYLDDRFAGPEYEQTYVTMAAHSSMWIMMAFGTALAVGLYERSKGSLGQCLVSGFGAALIAGVAYSPLAAALFPIAQSDLPIPEGSGNRLFWIMLPAVVISLALGRSKRHAESPASKHS